MATNYLIRKTGASTNGGTSRTVRSTGTDGIVNTTAGLTKITSITSSWSAADIGHGIYSSSGSKYTIITAYTAGTTVAVTTSNGSATMTSAALFSAGMVGQAVTGPGIAANTVIQAFTNSSSVTLSANAGVGAGAGTATLYNTLTVGTNMTAGTGQTWNVGGSWLTFADALVTTTTAITNGDKVYVGAGIYREVNTVGITSPTAEVQIIGDVDGVQTGDAGEVILSAYLNGDRSAPSSTSLLSLNGRDFLTFQKITFFKGNATGISAVAISTDIKLQDCTFLSHHNSIIVSVSGTFAVPLNWVIERCRFLQGANQVTIQVTLPTGSGSDYDANFVVKNCVFVSLNTCVSVASSGTSSQEGGGVIVRNCTSFGNSLLVTAGVRIGGSAFTFPCKCENSVVISGGSNCVNAGESGAITEDYNLFFAATPRSNVTAGTHSISDLSNALGVDVGQSLAMGFGPRQFFSPNVLGCTLGFGNASSAPTDDILSLTRPTGTIVKGDTGTATAGAAETLTDSGKAWGTNYWSGWTIKIISGTGSGQTKLIDTNTSTVITVHGNWKTNPSTDSVYMIYQGAPSSSGTATAGTTTTLTDSNANWPVNSWAGYTLEIDSGTGSPQSLVVLSNTATALTFATATAPDNTSTYKLYRGTNENTINAAVGCYERGDTATRETGTVRTGSNSIRLQGAGTFDITIPVDATSTTVTVYTRWDSAYSGTKPQMKVLNGTECGVADASATAVGSANAWEQLSLNFTPTSKGVVTIRFQANSTTPTGTTFYDDLAVA